MQEGERLVKVQYFRRYKGGGNKELKYLSFFIKLYWIEKIHLVMVTPFLVLNDKILNVAVVKHSNMMKPSLP